MQQIGNWQLRWLGHDSYQITKENVTIYIDPYQVETGRPADYILLTHEHYDHFDKASIDHLRNTNTAFFGPKSVAGQLDEMAITLEPGDQHQTKDFNLQAVIAYNIDKKFHPQADHKLGFILELDGQRLYHAGDTDLIPEMHQLGHIDVALIPVSGTYVMTAEQAIEATRIIQPGLAIPMHYGTIIGSRADAEAFAAGLENEINVTILEPESAI